jgi:hypothetical protein
MQQPFRLLIFLIQPYMFRATNSPILRSTFWLYTYSFWYKAPTLLPTSATVEMELTFHLNRGTGRQQCRCIVPKAVYTVKKCSWGWANLSPETCRAELKRLKNGKSCCILLVIYIVVLKWCTVTQTPSLQIVTFKPKSTLAFQHTTSHNSKTKSSTTYVCTGVLHSYCAQNTLPTVRSVSETPCKDQHENRWGLTHLNKK